MKIRWRIVSCLAVALLVAVIVLAVRSRAEPSCQGKSLSEWADQYYATYGYNVDPAIQSQAAVARNAICQIGTNALSPLLSMLQAKDARLITKLLPWLPAALADSLEAHSAERSRLQAVFGFLALGPLAKPAVPMLIHLLAHREPTTRASAIQALGAIGPSAEEAVPALVGLVVDRPSGWDRGEISAAMISLEQIHRRPDLVVPALLSILEDCERSAPPFAEAACRSLASFGRDAATARATLSRCARDANSLCWVAARDALNQINHELSFVASDDGGVVR